MWQGSRLELMPVIPSHRLQQLWVVDLAAADGNCSPAARWRLPVQSLSSLPICMGDLVSLTMTTWSGLFRA